MALNRERITMNPYEEATSNLPMEIGGDRFGHGIFVQSAGAQWGPPAQETPQIAQSVDTEGGSVIATTIGLRQSPTIKFQIFEPSDPADTNYVLNPQVPLTTTGYVQNAATGRFTNPLIRDLIGFDYALLESCVGTNANEGISYALSGLTAAQTYTAGVWLKGAVGGETVTLALKDVGGSSTTALTLTTNWQWYTVSRSNIGASAWAIAVTSTSVAQLAFFATGFCVVQNTVLTEYFDGTYPGCSWSGVPSASVSTRPASGGPRLEAIMADIERQVQMISRYRTGTIRRIQPNAAVTNRRITFDLVGATLNWDDLQFQNAGIVKGTISFQAQPFGRGAEQTSTVDAYLVNIPSNYVVDAGSVNNFSWGTGAGNIGLIPTTNLTTENRFLNNTSPYPFYQGEVSGMFRPGVTLTNYKGGVIIKRSAANTYLEAYASDNGTSSVLNLDKVVSGTRTNVATTAITRLSSGTNYAVRVRIQRQNNADNVYVEYFINPTDPIAVNATVVASLGPYVVVDTAFGALVPSLCGVVFTPIGTDAEALNSLRINPNLARERTLPALRFGLCGVPGTAPGLGRMVVGNISAFDQRTVRWGQLRDQIGRMSATTDLFYEAEALTVVSGSTAVTSPITGQSGGGNNTVRSAALSSVAFPILSTQLGANQLTHIGDFEVYARCYCAPAGTISLQLQWSTGDFVTWASNTAITTAGTQGTWQLFDMGMIRNPRTVGVSGNPQWQGRLVASTSAAGQGDQIYIDCIILVPVTEGSGIVTGSGQPGTNTPATLTAQDNFNELAGGALNAQTAPLGGNWSSVGSTTDFTLSSPTGTLTRSVTTDTGTIGDDITNTGGRFAVIGSAVGNCQVQADVFLNANIGVAGTGGQSQGGIILRWVNASNYLLVNGIYNGVTGVSYVPGALSPIFVSKVVAGVITQIGTTSGIGSNNIIFGNQTWNTIQCSVDISGNWTVSWGPQGGSLTQILSGVDTVLATGGTLASGTAGVWDWGGLHLGQRQYDNFLFGALAPDAAMFQGESVTVYQDKVYRQSASAATLNVPVTSYVGQYLKVPNPVYDDGVNLMMVKSSRTLVDSGIDPIEAQVNVTPRYAQVADF